jgi:thymidylate synthase
MYSDGLNNNFEHAHQKGLTRGFDLGWSYKGRFDRQIISDMIEELESSKKKNSAEIFILKKALDKLRNNPHNRENITLNFW